MAKVNHFSTLAHCPVFGGKLSVTLLHFISQGKRVTHDEKDQEIVILFIQKNNSDLLCEFSV